MLAFVFPGQGSQMVGMGQELVERYPVARQVFEEADDALGFSISKLCFEGPDEELRLTANSQPALLTMSVAVLGVIREEIGLAPLVAAGHSLGEYSALVCAEAMSFEDAVLVVHSRGRYMQEAVPVGEGTMAAVMGLGPEEVGALCEEAAEGQVLLPANLNGGAQVVIAGHTAAVERAIELADERGATAKRLAVSAPFHCPLMQPAAERLSRDLEELTLADPKIPVIANVDAEPNNSAARLVDLLTRQVTSTVRWEGCVRRMASMGVTKVVEVGVGTVLTSLIRRIDRGLEVSAAGRPSELEALKKRAGAEGDLKPFVSSLGELELAPGVGAVARDRSRIVFADGRAEPITEERWRFNDNGSKIRRWGSMTIIWNDGRVESLSPQEWKARFDGAFVKRDYSRIISRRGEVEDFDPSEWDISDEGTMRKKDGLRIILSDGIEWDFNDPRAHGF